MQQIYQEGPKHGQHVFGKEMPVHEDGQPGQRGRERELEQPAKWGQRPDLPGQQGQGRGPGQLAKRGQRPDPLGKLWQPEEKKDRPDPDHQRRQQETDPEQRRIQP